MGPSGSGKSTLMHLLAGLDRPTSGTVTIAGIELSDARRPRADAAAPRAHRLHLPDVQPAADARRAKRTSCCRCRSPGASPDSEWFDQLIDTVGIRDRLHHRPAELSGGQQQRVAVARALISRPSVVFADEPTGNLDSKASGEVLELLRHAVDDFGQTVVMVTHDAHAAVVRRPPAGARRRADRARRGGDSAEQALDLMKSRGRDARARARGASRSASCGRC